MVAVDICDSLGKVVLGNFILLQNRTVSKRLFGGAGFVCLGLERRLLLLFLLVWILLFFFSQKKGKLCSSLAGREGICNDNYIVKYWKPKLALKSWMLFFPETQRAMTVQSSPVSLCPCFSPTVLWRSKKSLTIGCFVLGGTLKPIPF